MKEVILDIKQWDNDLGVRLPAAIVREAQIHVDQQVRLSVVKKQILITPVLEAPLTLEQRLVHFDPARHGGEVMQPE